MKKCKSCKSEIDAKATKCPHCQTDQRNWFGRHKILTGILGIIIFFVIVGASGSKNGSADTNSTASDNQTASPSNKPEPTTATSVNKQANVPAEYKSALAQATTYANTMHLSKQGVYDQLVSAYGGKFSPEAAQYAVDNVKADWNANALAQAKTYQNTMNLSPTAVRDQLVSQYGGKFTAAEADYAIQHLNE